MLAQARLQKHLPGLSRPFSAATATRPSSSKIIEQKCPNSSTCRVGRRRGYTSGSSSSSQPPNSASTPLFSPGSPTWEHVFKNIDDMPPLLPRSSLINSVPPHTRPRNRRHTMTQREISAFDDMFNMIFNAVSETKPAKPSAKLLSEVGIGRSDMGDLLGRLRRYSRNSKWTTESDELLDRKKEEMDLCDTDQQLLEWAMREVFGESERYVEVAGLAITEAAKSNKKIDLPVLQPPAYPHLIALLMRAFRDKYHDPHLALSIFDHARYLSIPSYVFGCTTQAYNELIETRWSCFRDLKGVHDALEEMTVNAVDLNRRTVKLVETLRREVGERNIREDDSDGSGGDWPLLAKIEAFIQNPPIKPGKAREAQPQSSARNSVQKPKWDSWKAESFADADDDWEFDQWEARDPRKRR